MSAVCDVCHKKPEFGRQVSRAGRNAIRRYVKGKSPRLFRPNVQRIRVSVDGTVKRLNVCTSCMSAGKVTRPPF